MFSFLKSQFDFGRYSAMGRRVKRGRGYAQKKLMQQTAGDHWRS